MKLKMNIYLRILFILLLVIDFYLIWLDIKIKWLISIRYLIVPITMIIPTYLFWKQKQERTD